VRYTPEQEYGVHHDCNGMLRRYATVLLYLNDVDGGGETHFPAAGDDASAWRFDSVDEAALAFMAPRHSAAQEYRWAAHDTAARGGGAAARAEAAAAARDGGVRVAPRKGDALLFYNYDEAGVIDPRAVHAALPVTRGEKWVANFWLSLTPVELLLGLDGMARLGCS
jgi:prolyl 4-hydroxylase